MNQCIQDGDEGDDTSEVKREEFSCYDTEVRDGVKNMIATFTMKSPAQHSKQQWSFKSKILHDK
jgi:hypothetical protein